MSGDLRARSGRVRGALEREALGGQTATGSRGRLHPLALGAALLAAFAGAALCLPWRLASEAGSSGRGEGGVALRLLEESALGVPALLPPSGGAVLAAVPGAPALASPDAPALGPASWHAGGSAPLADGPAPPLAAETEAPATLAAVAVAEPVESPVPPAPVQAVPLAPTPAPAVPALAALPLPPPGGAAAGRPEATGAPSPGDQESGSPGGPLVPLARPAPVIDPPPPPVVAARSEESPPPAGGAAPARSARSRLIQSVQEALLREGLDPGPADGVEGPRTWAAVRDYQRRHGLRVDGAIDLGLLRRLDTPQVTPSREPPPEPPDRAEPEGLLGRVLGGGRSAPAEPGSTR